MLSMVLGTPPSFTTDSVLVRDEQDLEVHIDRVDDHHLAPNLVRIGARRRTCGDLAAAIRLAVTRTWVANSHSGRARITIMLRVIRC